MKIINLLLAAPVMAQQGYDLGGMRKQFEKKRIYDMDWGSLADFWRHNAPR